MAPTLPADHGSWRSSNGWSAAGARPRPSTTPAPEPPSPRAPTMARMDVVEFGRLTDTQRAELEGDEDDPFDAAGDTLKWRSKDRHVALRGPEGHLVASAGLVLAEVQVADLA